MLDFFLASVRKEPHLGLNQTFKSDRDAPDHSQESHYPPDHLQLYQLSFIRQAPVTIIFCPFPQPCGRCAKTILSKTLTFQSSGL